MSISEYGCKAIETGSGEVRTATANVGKMAQLGQLHVILSPEQMTDESVLVALAMLLDNKVKISHKDGEILTMFFRS